MKTNQKQSKIECDVILDNAGGITLQIWHGDRIVYVHLYDSATQAAEDLMSLADGDIGYSDLDDNLLLSEDSIQVDPVNGIDYRQYWTACAEDNGYYLWYGPDTPKNVISVILDALGSEYWWGNNERDLVSALNLLSEAKK